MRGLRRPVEPFGQALKVPIQRRQHTQVLRPSSGFLRLNDISEVRYKHLDTVDGDAMCTRFEI